MRVRRIHLLVVILAIAASLIPFRARVRPLIAKDDSAPVETTTAGQRARGESSFSIRKERTFGISWLGFFTLVLLGCLAFAVLWAVISRVFNS